VILGIIILNILGSQLSNLDQLKCKAKYSDDETKQQVTVPCTAICCYNAVQLPETTLVPGKGALSCKNGHSNIGITQAVKEIVKTK